MSQCFSKQGTNASGKSNFKINYLNQITSLGIKCSYSCVTKNDYSYNFRAYLTQFRMGIFGAAHGWGPQKGTST